MPQALLLNPQVRGLHKASLILSPPGRAERKPLCKSLPPLGILAWMWGQQSVGQGWGSSPGPQWAQRRWHKAGLQDGVPCWGFTPPQRSKGKSPQHPCHFRVQTPLWLGGTAQSWVERGTLWISTCLTHHHPHTEGGTFYQPGDSFLCCRCHHNSVFRDMVLSAWTDLCSSHPLDNCVVGTTSN